MKKYSFAFLLLFVLQMGFSQNKTLWKGYFSYNEIKDVSQSTDKLFAASENALFSKNVQSGEIKTTNTVDGLSGQTISSLYHSPNFKKTMVGYENGLMIIINEVDGSMLNVVDIINKALPSNMKKINHFMEYNGIVYISCDFGIVQYNLATLQFGDTYFIGDGGTQISVTQTAVFNGKIYASTLFNGIRNASISNPNLNDFKEWTTVANFGWSGVEAFGADLMAITTSGNLQKLQGNSFVNVTTLSENALDIRNCGAYLVVTTKHHVLIFNATLSQIADVNSNQILGIEPQFSCATVIAETVFIGTSDDGIISHKIGESSFENSTPDGPLRNDIFAISSTTKNLWAVYGGYDQDYNPYGFYSGPTKFGVSKFGNKGWLNIPYKDLLEARSLSRITINPNNENQVFVSSYYSGLLKFENDQLSILYNVSNTGSEGLQSVAGQVPDDIRVNGTVFDKSGNLWVTSSLVKKGLKVLKTNGEWKSYAMESIKPSGTFFFGRLIIDKNGTKWMTTLKDGIIGFNENYNNLFKTIKNGSDSGNLPIEDAKVAAIDARNQMWIGTRKGLRVLSSVDSFLSSNQLTTSPIIILEENLAQELLYEQSIIDIVVDGANNKWIGTADSGVFLVSPNGQQTIYHFTVNNSPLPSNTINDIDINGTTGEVFIATTRGMVSFKGTSTDPNENLENVYVYPNPVRPEYVGTVKISGLIDNANIKITDIEGNLVYETISEGGTFEWDTTAFGKYKVASGVYMIFISAQDGIETKVKKVMIIR
ncbi:type IX secretion system anionic LPS delivery protein PorZ [Flavobacterium psychrotolerans]|uniref:ABC transporter substrate-binding protein n=1 Tax=Flavobacterium psychrotolerans TaxID=2169410 RepID=A0A2U1JGM5_9FLAO|nr:T9SS type A sorting domain-containing protein [Flavobacterium psychrotolerans]PWA04300.1 ABC transporter substrate-binding protein [Flavobacterium psychrotolerans]